MKTGLAKIHEALYDLDLILFSQSQLSLKQMYFEMAVLS